MLSSTLSPRRGNRHLVNKKYWFLCDEKLDHIESKFKNNRLSCLSRIYDRLIDTLFLHSPDVFLNLSDQQQIETLFEFVR